MPAHFHAIFVHLAVVFVGLCVVLKEIVEVVAEAHVGVANANFLELFAVEWRYKGKEFFRECLIHIIVSNKKYLSVLKCCIGC